MSVRQGAREEEGMASFSPWGPAGSLSRPDLPVGVACQVLPHSLTSFTKVREGGGWLRSNAEVNWQVSGSVQ